MVTELKLVKIKVKVNNLVSRFANVILARSCNMITIILILHVCY